MEMALDYDMEEAPSSPPSPVVREWPQPWTPSEHRWRHHFGGSGVAI